MAEKKNHGRAYGNTQLTISIPTTLKERIAQEAAAENRSISNWCVQKLRAVIARQGLAGTAALDMTPGMTLKVAEESEIDRLARLAAEEEARNGTEGK